MELNSWFEASMGSSMIADMAEKAREQMIKKKGMSKWNENEAMIYECLISASILEEKKADEYWEWFRRSD